MSGYTDSEKIQYALKTALYRTMQTAMSGSADVERSAPLRVFPTNIMKVNITEAGKGDIDEDGKYITNAQATIQTLQTDLSTANTTIQTLQADLSNANTTIQQHETIIQQQQQQIADILSRLESLESSA